MTFNGHSPASRELLLKYLFIWFFLGWVTIWDGSGHSSFVHLLAPGSGRPWLMVAALR